MVSNYWEECYSCNEGNSRWTLKKPFRPVLTGKGLVWGRGSSRSILCNNEKGGKERWWKPSFRISRVPFPHQIHCPRGSRDCGEESYWEENFFPLLVLNFYPQTSCHFLSQSCPFLSWDIYFQLNNWRLMNLLPFFRSSRNFISLWLQWFRRFGMLSASCLLSPKFFFQALLGNHCLEG